MLQILLAGLELENDFPQSWWGMLELYLLYKCIKNILAVFRMTDQ